MSSQHTKRVPSILFVGQSKAEVDKLITSVTNIACNSEGVVENAVWNVDCKYYTANINIKSGTFQTVPSSKDMVEALVILFDPKNESSIGALFAYVDQLKSTKPDVCLAVCENFENSVESYENIAQFCSECRFELVELSPTSESIAESENANEESVRYESKDEYGSVRVLNALLANPWTGMKRKKWTPPVKGGASVAANEEAEKETEKTEADSKTSSSETEALADSCANQMTAVFSNSSDSKSSGSATTAAKPASGAADGNMDDLLSKLKQLKAKSANLSDDDRKKYAERVAKSFAHATGVDDD